MPHTASPAAQDLHAVNDLFAQGHYADAEARAATLAEQHPQPDGALGILALAARADDPGAFSAAGGTAPDGASRLYEATAAVTAERLAMQQAGGLAAVPWLHVMGDDAAAPSPLSRFIDTLLDQHGGLEAYLAALTPAQCQADARRCLAATGDDAGPAAQPLALHQLGLVGLWFPQLPVVFYPRELAEQGLAAYLAAVKAADAGQPAPALHAIGERLAEAEQARQHWARVLPNPVYWVTPAELAATPATVARRLTAALPPANRPAEEATAEALQAACPATHWVAQTELARAFKPHLAPLLAGYQDAMEASGLPAQSIEGFDWQLQGRVVTVDNAAQLPRQANFAALMATNAFAVVAFDPASRVTAENLAEVEEFQHVPHVLLGDGHPATLHATLDESLTAPLEPLPDAQLPASLHGSARVLTRLPINTLRLDDIDGLASLDWLILDELADAHTVLENGERALAHTLLLQVGVAFAPTHYGQADLARISHWASRHGFTFYRLNNLRHRSLMPQREGLARPQATQLASADALFIPSPERLAALDANQRKRLAFVLDTVYGIHDLPHQLLAEVDDAMGERYLKARGYLGVHRSAKAKKQPPLFAVPKARRRAERGLEAALAQHNSHRALGQARQLLKDHPDDPDGRYYQGRALSQLGRHDPACAQLDALYQEAPTLRYGLALGEARHRAGRNKAVRRIADKLAEQHPDHLAVARLALLPVLASHKRRELNEALERCRTLLDHTDAALVAAGLGDAPTDAASARAELLHLAACFQQALADDAPTQAGAVDAHQTALAALGDRQGPLRAQMLIALAEARLAAGDVEPAVETLWQACATRPLSLHTATAAARLHDALGQSPYAEHRQLASLHARLNSAWRRHEGKALTASLGDYGLPTQGMAPLMLAGNRPTPARLEHYGLQDLLPQGATALDIGCHQGFLLLALADVLGQGTGIDARQPCVEVGNAAVEHTGHAHIQLHHQTLADYVAEGLPGGTAAAETSRFDLVIASAVHQHLHLPEEDFGDALARLCKPGGVVLLESHGTSQPRHPEPGFTDRATAVASAGFSVIRQGALCDDGINYREFWLLQREAEPQAAPRPGAGQAHQHRLPVIEGDAAITRPMHAICRAVAEEGAWFNPDLRIHADNGNLSLYGTPGAARASYMRVPMTMMPQLEGFDIEAKKGRLVATPNGMKLLPRQQEMLEAMLELFNVTDKLNLWQASLPFLAWQQTPKVLDYLLSARPHDSKLRRFRKQQRAGEHSKLLVDSFIGSRQFGLRPHHLDAMGVKDNPRQRNVLLPLVDCLNHSLEAEGFYTPMAGGNPVMRTYHRPDAHTGELLVRYNYNDAVTTTLNYGFVDAASHWLASVPVTLSVSGQTLAVQGVAMQFSGTLPAALADIRPYIPGTQRKNSSHATVTKLMLCTQNPHSLRRVLTYLVHQLGLAHTDFVARQQVAELERQLIEQNRQWWQGFAALTAELPADHPARQLCHHSLGLIEQVAEALGH